MKRKRFQKGFSMIEALIASTVLSGVIASAVTLQTVTLQRTRSTNDKAFATQKAMQMFEELRAYVQANRETDISKLQNFSDGSAFNFVLTTEKREISTAAGTVAQDLTNPADPLSGNTLIPGTGNKWKYVRQVQVKPVANDTNARHVTVSVYYANLQTNNLPKGDVERPLAVISGVLKTNISQDPPTQMYDLFVLTMENAPSWWVDLADLRPSFERTLIDLEQRNPGLIFRRHFVSRFGYGRDPFYMPYINDAANADAQALPWVYLYPGRTDDNKSLGQNYVKTSINGRRRSDDSNELYPVERNHTNYGGERYRYYALADQFNHVLRYPEQKAMEERLVEEDRNTFRDSPSLVNVLEDLNTSSRYKNAILINLHGELLPLPAIRNYSDPAKAPNKHALKLNAQNAGATRPTDGSNTNDINFTSLRNMRAVSHPENLQYSNGSNVAWRVYAFEEYPQGNSDLATDNSGSILRAHDSIPQISLFIPTIGQGPHYNGSGNGFLQNYPDFTPTALAGLSLERLVGGRVVGGSGTNNATNRMGFQAYSWWGFTASAANLSTDNTSGTNTLGTVNILTDSDIPCNNLASVSTGAPFDFSCAGAPATRARFVGGGFFAPNVRGTAFSAGVTIGNSYSTTLSASPNAITQLNGAAIPVAGSSGFTGLSSITFANNFAPSQVEALTGMLIYLGRGTPNEKVVRITGFPAPNQINFEPSVNISAGTNLPITAGSGGIRDILRVPIVRYRDYDATIIDETMYGQPHRGIKINLYDTPTRHNSYQDGNPQVVSAGEAAGGLENADRVEGLEYIPAPVNGLNFNKHLADTTRDFKNTARWRVSLDTSQYSTNFNNRNLVLETRINTLDNDTSEPARGLCTTGTNLGELCDGIWGDGDTHIPNLVSTSENEHQTTLRPNMYNVSRTYTYLNHFFSEVAGTAIAAGYGSDIPDGARLIPKVEQAQFMGDALYNPYLDIKQINRYSRHFRDRRDAVGNGLSGFNGATGPSWDSDNIDLNWFFNLYSSGIMRSNAIYNSISGFSNYYYALGGEIGTDGTNAIFGIRSQPWVATANGGASVNNDNDTVREIIGGGSRTIVDTNATQNNRWRMRPYLGQLFPDEEFNFWRINGNLPSHDFNNTTHNRDPLVTLNGGALRYFRSRTDQAPRSEPFSQRRINTQGAPSFMNGNTAANPLTSDSGFEHLFQGGNGLLTKDAATDAGSQLVNAYNLTLADSMTSNRPFILNGGSGSGGYTSAEIKGIRNRLNFVNTTTGVISSTSSTQNVYYRHNTNVNTRTSSSFVRMTRPNPAAPASDLNGWVGYALMNGFNDASASGVQSLARFSQAASLQTFMDAGDRSVPGSAAGRTVQLPRVKVTEPRSSQVYENPTTITVNFNVAWLRWDDKKYSPAYPNNWRDSTPLLYNIKYSSNNKASWKYANSNVDVPLQFLDLFNPTYSIGAAENSPSNSWDKTFSWDVGGFAEGNYVLRVEAYRQGFDTGYSYHDVFVTIDR